jgi:hypothetical protein
MSRYRALSAKAPERRDVETSVYRYSCPSCGAPPWHRCLTANGVRHGKTHVERETRACNTGPLPDLRDWWRAMAPYEGPHRKPRPEGLTV